MEKFNSSTCHKTNVLDNCSVSVDITDYYTCNVLNCDTIYQEPSAALLIKLGQFSLIAACL